MYTAGNIILLLKIAVSAVTVLLVASLLALAFRKFKLHGRINMAVFALTITALVGLEVIARLLTPNLFNEFFTATDAWNELYIHLAFSTPAAVLLPVMLLTGLRHRTRLHYSLGIAFVILWAGTFVTGVFFLPHALP